MTQEEALDIIRFVFLHTDNHLNDDRKISAEDIHEALVMACAALCKNSLPSDLDEAAEEIVKDWLAYGDGEYKKLAIAGAEWMAGQGASYNTKVGWIDGPTVLDWPDDILDKFEMGDEVIVQIRKK